MGRTTARPRLEASLVAPFLRWHAVSVWPDWPDGTDTWAWPIRRQRRGQPRWTCLLWHREPDLKRRPGVSFHILPHTPSTGNRLTAQVCPFAIFMRPLFIRQLHTPSCRHLWPADKTARPCAETHSPTRSPSCQCVSMRVHLPACVRVGGQSWTRGYQ
ncbi:unnamed protein product [Protopolystoma xenopodis]|uniref:Uncharacterized protein n=1 Tax=Protopolystoma xenopodis TaxID=117903 RepID=A0A3S5AQL2_9PLAT|nr:unnamed protein product [Protopolystoma xenopodis]